MGSPEPLDGQALEYIVESAESPQCPHGRRKTCLHVFYYRLVFHGREVLQCAILRELELTAREMLSHRAVNRKLDQLENQERRDVHELQRKVPGGKFRAGGG